MNIEISAGLKNYKYDDYLETKDYEEFFPNVAPKARYFIVWRIFQKLKQEGKVFQVENKGKMYLKWGHFCEFTRNRQVEISSQINPSFDVYRGRKSV